MVLVKDISLSRRAVLHWFRNYFKCINYALMYFAFSLYLNSIYCVWMYLYRIWFVLAYILFTSTNYINEYKYSSMYHQHENYYFVGVCVNNMFELKYKFWTYSILPTNLFILFISFFFLVLVERYSWTFLDEICKACSEYQFIWFLLLPFK